MNMTKTVYVAFVFILLWNLSLATYYGEPETLQGTLVYRGDGGIIHCMVYLMYLKPPTFVGSGLCLYDDWGNFLGEPESYIIKVDDHMYNVSNIFLHPRFWYTNTQNNIAVFHAEMETYMFARYGPSIIKIPEDRDEASSCTMSYTRLQGKIERTSFDTEILNRDKYCFQQMYPLVLRLRYDNLCARIPAFGTHPALDRHYTGAPIICTTGQSGGDNGDDGDDDDDEDDDYEDNGDNWSRADSSVPFLYAILSFNYACDNWERVAVFTRISYHRNFIIDPKRYILEQLSDFKRRTYLKPSTAMRNHQMYNAIYFITLDLMYFLLRNKVCA